MNAWHWALITVLSGLLCLSFRKRTKRYKNVEQPVVGRLVTNLCSCSLYYFVPLFLVAILFLGLTFWLANFGDSIAFSTLVEVERRLDAISEFFSDYIRLTELEVLLLLVALVILGYLGVVSGTLFQQSRQALFRYHKLTTPVYAFLAILTSFTLLGSQVGTPLKTVQLQIDSIQKGYAEVVKRVEAEINHRFTVGVYQQIMASFPADYKTAIQAQGTVDSRIEELDIRYASSWGDYAGRDKALDSFLEREKARIKKAAAVNTELNTEVHGSGASAPGRSAGDVTSDHAGTAKKESVPRGGVPRTGVEAGKKDPGARGRVEAAKKKDVTTARVEAAKKESAKLASHPQAAPIKIPIGGRTLLLQAPKVSRELLTQLFKPIIADIPILEPLVAALEDTVDKAVEERLKKATERTVAEAMRDPSRIAAVVPAETNRVLAETRSVVTPERLAQADEEVGRFQRIMQDVGNYRSRIDRKAANKLIANLSDRNEEVRIMAAAELADNGDKVNRREVRKIARLMRSGNLSWHKSWRSSHCTCTETTSVRWYAADVLTNLDSKHVTRDLKKEAAQVKERTEKSLTRTTDPGWICLGTTDQICSGGLGLYLTHAAGCYRRI